MSEGANSGLGGWIAQAFNPQFILSAIAAAVTIITLASVAQERLNAMLVRQTAIEADFTTRNNTQDARWAADHERVLLLEAKLVEQAKEINRTNGVLDRNSVDREQLVASVIARINTVESNAAAKIANIETDQRKIGELMATLIERLSNVAEQLERLNKLMQDRLPAQRSAYAGEAR